MLNEDLVDAIAETLYLALRDEELEELYLPYAKLADEIKDKFRSIAHKIINTYDDWYDEEFDDDEELDDDEERYFPYEDDVYDDTDF